jgi:ABC-type lipoprotein release transport system permease subunit
MNNEELRRDETPGLKKRSLELLLKMGWRNIWRNKRRTIITMLAVTFALTLSIGMRGIQLGTYEVNIKYVVELFTGHLQIQRQGYQENPTLQKSFVITDSLRRLVEQDPRIVASAPRLLGDGLISFQENSLGALIIGISPSRERAFSKIMTKIHSGRFFREDTAHDIVVGAQLLDNLKAHVGDKVVVLAQGLDGTLGNYKYRIVGTMKTGSPEFDGGSIFVGLSAAQELLAAGNRVSMVALMLKDLQDIPSVQSSLKEGLAGTGLSVLAWNEVLPDLEQSIQLDNVSGMLMLGILIVVVAFGIANTVLMSVTERFREFGVALSIGMPREYLVVLVLFETLFIVLIGIVIGNMLGSGINYYIMRHPIVFGGEYEQVYAEYGFLPRIESTLRPGMLFNSTIATIIISLLATLYPLMKVYRLQPLKGIRYT